MDDAINQALQAGQEAPATFMEQDEFNKVCEGDAPTFIDHKYCDVGWAKNIRREYCEMVYKACSENLNKEEGIFSVDGVDMDLAGQVSKFFHKHPHTEYCCPASWRESVLKKLKENFTAGATKIRSNLGPRVLEDDGVIPAPEDEVINDDPTPPTAVKKPAAKSAYNPNQSVVQTLHDVSNRIWSAWRVMSDLASVQLVNRMNMGDMDEKAFNGALRLRDDLRKLASSADDLATAFRIVKKEEDDEGEEA